MQEKEIFGTIISALVVSLMALATIGSSTMMFASAQQQTNTTGTEAQHAEGEAGGTMVTHSQNILGST
jgi:hypothetical protein